MGDLRTYHDHSTRPWLHQKRLVSNRKLPCLQVCPISFRLLQFLTVPVTQELSIAISQDRPLNNPQDIQRPALETTLTLTRTTNHRQPSTSPQQNMSVQ